MKKMKRTETMLKLNQPMIQHNMDRNAFLVYSFSRPLCLYNSFINTFIYSANFFGTSVGLYHSYTKSELSRMVNLTIREKYGGNIRGGFRGYDSQYVIYVGPEMFDDVDLMKPAVKKFLDVLKVNTLYSMLPIGVYKDKYGNIVYKTLLKESVKLSKLSKNNELAYALHNGLVYILEIYELESIDKIILYYKVWVTENELKVSYTEATNVLNQVLDRRLAENRIVNQSLNTEVSPSSVAKLLLNLKQKSNMAPILKF